MKPSIDKVPGLKELLDDCSKRASELIGFPVTMTFQIKVKYITTEQLAYIICDELQVSWADICSEKKYANMVMGRHLYCWFAFMIQKKKLKEIAKIINREDHSTIIHARDKIQRMIETNDELYMPVFNAVQQRIDDVLI